MERHTMVAAGRYRDWPGRSLISAELFPLYWFAMRALFGLWLTIRVIVAVFQFEGTTASRSILLSLGP